MSEFEAAGNGADKRKYRLDRIRNLIAESRGVSVTSVLGFCVYNLGLTEKRAESYIKSLTKYGIIYRRGDKLYARKG